MATNIQSTQLDFDQIKNKLKNYLSAKTEFADYDFEGAGLSNILDVLAYNTHFNALTANMALNEAFISTAQLRSSVISHAEALGFSIRSATSSQARFTATLNLAGVANRAQTYVLPVDSVFTGSNENGSFQFLTTQAFTATDDGTGLYTFVDADGVSGVTAFEGTKITKTFFVGQATDRQIYIIPDADIDTTTAIIKVFESPSSTVFEEYTPLKRALTVNAKSTYYTLREVPNGTFELNFGDGVTFGKSPEAGSKIEVTYLRTTGPSANEIKSFSTSVQYNVGGTNFALQIVPQANSAGGANKQGIDSIKDLAASAFATQQRLVTPEDYRSTIAANFPTVKDVSVWGGEDNVPVNYGKVYVALDFNDGLTNAAKIIVKDNIKSNFTNNLSVMSITPEFVDPIEIFIDTTTSFTFNPDLTGSTALALENKTRVAIRDYLLNTVSGFNKTFRRSNLLTDIDEVDIAVLNSRMNIKLQQRLIPTLDTPLNYELVYPVQLANADDVLTIIESDLFQMTGVTGNLKVVNTLSSNKLKIINVDDADTVVQDNVGNFNSLDGTLSLINFNPGTILSGSNFIKFSAVPQNESEVRSQRNFVFKVDEERFTVTSSVDRQGNRVAL